MALMFQRIARNYAKDGYFPTDSVTTMRILNMLTPCRSGSMRLIDPCAGEGVALAECRHTLHNPDQSQTVETFGVEYHPERSKQAKQLLDRCLQGDFQDTIITPRAFGLLWLNPPYGDLVTDKGQTGGLSGKGKKRLEKIFYQKSARLLQYGGVMVLIVPHYTLDHEFRKWIAAGFENVRIYLAPEQQFKQAVVMGIRRRTSLHDEHYRTTLAALEQFSVAEIKPVLPERDWPVDACYEVPAAVSGEIRFNATRIGPLQLQEEISKYPCLWSQFDAQMNRVSKSHKRPLMALSDWHLALALAAGQVSGVVHSNDGKKTYVIKGDTFKDKKQSVQVEPLGNGEFREIRTSLDVFVPQIKAIDFTPQSPTFGEILTIK